RGAGARRIATQRSSGGQNFSHPHRMRSGWTGLNGLFALHELLVAGSARVAMTTVICGQCEPVTARAVRQPCDVVDTVNQAKPAALVRPASSMKTRLVPWPIRIRTNVVSTLVMIFT